MRPVVWAGSGWGPGRAGGRIGLGAGSGWRLGQVGAWVRLRAGAWSVRSGLASAEAEAGDGLDQFAFLVGEVGPEGVAEQVSGLAQTGQGGGVATGRDERDQGLVHAVEDVMDDPVLGLQA